MPPSIRIVAPVVKLDASDARYSAAPTHSSGRPMRPNGTIAPDFISGVHALVMSVSTGPGRIAFTRTVGAYASARPTVSALSPALAHAYGSSFVLASSEPTVPTLMIDPPSCPAMY